MDVVKVLYSSDENLKFGGVCATEHVYIYFITHEYKILTEDLLSERLRDIYMFI